MDDPNQTSPEPIPPQSGFDLDAGDLPERISRYVVKRVLGKGGFGVVYLAHDEQLRRPVAIKVPHAELVTRAEDAEPYLAEARTVAGLDHPNIVTVHDVGGTPEFPFFVVSKYIEGSDLKERLKEARPSVLEAVELTATVAETLHFAHRQGLVHRDIKPGNILLERRAGDFSPPVPYVADFGLALSEENVGKGSRFVGTPSYMSPEQARGEGHRVDGRSDIFSLGIVFYEMLTGRRPFAGQTRDEVLDQIATLEARPLRQWDDTIPKELERICLKALSKRAADRYLTAKDMADDLRSFQEQSTEEEKSVLRSGIPPMSVPSPTTGATPTPSSMPKPASDSEPLRIVPKGLRSFDAHDADFFLELLPGPRDRGGLPDSIRFWKTRIEETDADNTFAVGLIYGPSGCGKSSLVKAGLLPRLSENVLAVYVEAAAEETEARLLKGLRKCCRELSDQVGLAESIAVLRRGQVVRSDRIHAVGDEQAQAVRSDRIHAVGDEQAPMNRGTTNESKVLIVLDQFEQWLHAKREQENTELVQALRQCDGSRVQCVVLVRDDFWMAATRFMRELEIRLVEGRNSAAVDLFPMRHAEKVLAAFGRAFDALPKDPAATSKDQKQFLEQAVSGLAQEGKVICIRLALFAEMMKGKSWTPATLKQVGGAEGVGVTFLEETFSAATAPPEHRVHQKAARAVLKALLPESRTDIKGHMRSHADLLTASDYASRPRDFEDLLRILDSEIRLITPTDPEGTESPLTRSASEGAAHASLALRVSGEARCYQLTHDYLVPSLRDWLTRKQRETRRGRAELRLAERAAAWNSKPENRHLPAWWEWANIRLYTRKRAWTMPQRRIMRRAGRYHALHGSLLGLMLALIVFGGWWTYGAMRARHLVDTLLAARTADVPDIVRKLGPYRRWADPLLRDRTAQAHRDEGKRLHVALALLPIDPEQTDTLCDHLLKARGPDEVKAIRELLAYHAPDATARFWPVLEDNRAEASRRLRAGCVLALSPSYPRWGNVADDVVRCLASENILLLRDWADLLEPVRAQLVPHVARRLAEADAGVFATFLAILRAYPGEARTALHAILNRALPATAKQEDRESLARQQAQAAAALLHLKYSDRVWPLFHQPEDPTLRTYLIHRCAALGVDPAILANHLLRDDEKDASVRQGLLLALGEYSADQRAELVRGPFVDLVVAAYRNDPDPGVHSAAEWLLRRWQMADRLARIDQDLRKAGPGLVQGRLDKPRWYVNGQGQTFAVIPAPGKFWIGSPPDEKGRMDKNEDRHEVRIDYAFAVATKLVTVAEFKKCLPDFEHPKQWSPGEDTPINGVSWYDAARYCNWLSEQEKIPKDQWCYEPNANGKYAEGMKVKANYQNLSGYRLPRAAEGEYACRAGTVTAWSHGSEEAMIRNYAWYAINSNSTMHPVGSLKPNGLGLFDMHGNVYQWCQDVLDSEGNNTDIEHVINDDARACRGGVFALGSSLARSAYLSRALPLTRQLTHGFRVARTYR